MAFRALYIWFSQFRKIPFNDWVYWYSEYVLKKPEQREAERKRHQKEAKTAMANLLFMDAIMSYMSDYRR